MNMSGPFQANGHSVERCDHTTGHSVRAVAFCDNPLTATLFADLANSDYAKGADADGFYPWSGGRWALAPSVQVIAKLRSGQTTPPRLAGGLDWDHTSSDSQKHGFDIVAYKFVG